MTPVGFVVTSMLLGAFVAFGGLYAVLLSVGYVMREARWGRLARVSYLVQCAIVATILAFTALSFWWKVLIVASAAAYYFVPPMTWRYLTHLHQPSEEAAS